METKQKIDARKGYQRRVNTPRKRPADCQPKKSSIRREVNADVLGGRMHVPSNPPDFMSQPWSHMTLALTAKGSQTLTIGNIVTHFRQQFDKDSKTLAEKSAFTMMLQINSVRAWNLTGRTIAMSAYDFTPTRKTTEKEEQLGGWVDTGGISAYPKLGYRFPAYVRGTPVRNDTATGLRNVAYIAVDEADVIMVYLDILWRSDSEVSTPQYFDTMIAQIAKSNVKIANQTLRIARNATQIAANTKVVADAQPSVVERTIGGVSEVASVVVPVLAAGELDTIRTFVREVIRDTLSIPFSGHIDLQQPETSEKAGDDECSVTLSDLALE